VFHKNIRVNWSEVIAHKVWDYIKDDFDFDPATRFSESQIDSNLLKLFYQMKSFQSNILYEVFVKGLRNYLRFILSFANRTQQLKESVIMNTIRNTSVIRIN